MSYDQHDADRDAAYDYFVKELTPDIIDDYKWELQVGYYVEHSDVLKTPLKMLLKAVSSLEQSQWDMALIYAVISIEVSAKEVLLRPLIHGTIHNSKAADIIVGLLTDGQTLGGAIKPLRKFSTVIEDMVSKKSHNYEQIMTEIEKYCKRRNSFLHSGRLIDEIESIDAVHFAQRFVNGFVIDFLASLKFHIHDDDSICNHFHLP